MVLCSVKTVGTLHVEIDSFLYVVAVLSARIVQFRFSLVLNIQKALETAFA